MSDFGEWTCTAEGGRMLAGAGTFHVTDQRGDLIAIVPVPIHGLPRTMAEAEATTRLIARAPEMLVALRDIVDGRTENMRATVSRDGPAMDLAMHAFEDAMRRAKTLVAAASEPAS